MTRHDTPLIDPPSARETVSVDAVLAMAAAWLKSGDLATAAYLYEQVLTKLPDQPVALTMLGSIAYRRGEDQDGDIFIERAISAWRCALEGVPSASPLHAGLANLLLARSQPIDAFKRLANVKLALNPVRSSLAEFHASRERAKAAKRPSILMATMPKSASESLWNILAGGLGLGQSHVSIGLFPDCCLVPCRLHEFAAGGVIAKEHIAPNPQNLAALKEAGIERVLVHLRDPRQAMLSWAHFVRDDVSRRLLAPIWRKTVPPARTLAHSLDGVIAWCLDHYLPLLIDYASSWHRLEAYGDACLQVRCLTFEDFVADREAYIADVLDFYDITSMSMRTTEQAAAVHWRRGRTDEWRNVLTDEQRQRASDMLPRALGERFGWEP